MKSKRILMVALCLAGSAAMLALAKAPVPQGAGAQGQPAPRPGQGVQAARDPREPAVLAQCKNLPPARGGGGGAAGGGEGGGGAQAGPRDYTVMAIPGVIAAGQQWKILWTTDGNNSDGIVGTNDGGMLIAQNNNSDVVKLDKDGKPSVVYTDTNTGGSLSMNKKGELFIVERSLNPAVWELAPKHRLLANMYMGDPLDCIGAVLNDLSADSKGGVYFNMGPVFYANPQGVVTKYGPDLRTNGIILSPDEKTLYVTNPVMRNGQNVSTLVAFDVQPDGSLTNQREFAVLEGGGGDGSAVDSEARIYVSGGPGIHVVAPDGKYLGTIPTPHNTNSVAFGGRNKKTLYASEGYNENGVAKSAIIVIPMIAQGYKGRAK